MSKGPKKGISVDGGEKKKGFAFLNSGITCYTGLELLIAIFPNMWKSVTENKASTEKSSPYIE